MQTAVDPPPVANSEPPDQSHNGDAEPPHCQRRKHRRSGRKTSEVRTQKGIHVLRSLARPWPLCSLDRLQVVFSVKCDHLRVEGGLRLGFLRLQRWALGGSADATSILQAQNKAKQISANA